MGGVMSFGSGLLDGIRRAGHVLDAKDVAQYRRVLAETVRDYFDVSVVSAWMIHCGESIDARAHCVAYSARCGLDMDTSALPRLGEVIHRSDRPDLFSRLSSVKYRGDFELQGYEVCQVDEMLAPAAFASALDAPAMINGRTTCVICLADASAGRSWRLSDVSILRRAVSAVAVQLSDMAEAENGDAGRLGGPWQIVRALR